VPRIIALSPPVSSRDGGARVTIFGESFQSPVQVFAIHADGSQDELQIIGVRFDQIELITPPSRVDEVVGIRVVNVADGTSVTLPDALRYVAPLSITSAGPLAGSFEGGTQITIEGSGFASPAFVNIGGTAAQVVEVTDHRLVVTAPPFAHPQCSDHSGAISVISGTGLQAMAGSFTYTTPRSELRFAPSEAVGGGMIPVIVIHGGAAEFQFGGTRLEIESATDNGDGTMTYRVRIPDDLPFSMRNKRLQPLSGTLSFLNVDTGCRDARPLFVRPPAVEPRRPPLRDVP
jgi:hypothetical protein